LATQPKGPPPNGATAAETKRVEQLARRPEFLSARRWLARERAWTNDQQLQICRIPAPTFFEEERAKWLRARLESFGWNAKLDRAGNVLARFGNSDQPAVLVSAHLDTVIAPARPEEVYCGADGRFWGAGISDNGSGLTALLTLARLFAEEPGLAELASQVMLVANVGEEGEGNLSGMRYLCTQTQPASIKAFIVLDGPATDHITAQALASRRFEVSFSGPGGHSWNDHGTPNPVHALAALINTFVEAAEARAGSEVQCRSSYNFGVIEGGASINAIAPEARAKLDLRSEDPATLDEFAALLTTSVEKTVEHGNRSVRQHRLAAKIKELGTRPGGKLAAESPLLRAVQAVDAHLNIRSRVDCASTDANIPLSMGLPALSIGAGGLGGGAHTRQEWYQPEGRELGLARILLLLAALANPGAGE
jgi:acetylornithine deacetylase/succinyl-diaminopimelate desuccinylase-like protein